jgi:hypothetical protein
MHQSAFDDKIGGQILDINETSFGSRRLAVIGKASLPSAEADILFGKIGSGGLSQL